jgi:hypothetical protein
MWQIFTYPPVCDFLRVSIFKGVWLFVFRGATIFNRFQNAMNKALIQALGIPFGDGKSNGALAWFCRAIK